MTNVPHSLSRGECSDVAKPNKYLCFVLCRYKHNPPMPRNTPPVTGNILWCRHLLKRIEQPMKEFERNPNILATKEARRIVKTFNNVARTLVSFEYLWYVTKQWNLSWIFCYCRLWN